jgi:rubredoxin
MNPHDERAEDTASGVGLVREDFRCPRCGERRLDCLEFEDDDRVRCGSCNHVYDPLITSR